jgi:hypothetical protein
MKQLFTSSTAITILFILFCIPAYSSDILLNSDAYCKKVALAVGGNQEIESACLTYEMNAKKQLSNMKIADNIKTHCTKIAKMAGGSYQVLKTCVEQESSTKQHPAH